MRAISKSNSFTDRPRLYHKLTLGYVADLAKRIAAQPRRRRRSLGVNKPSESSKKSSEESIIQYLRRQDSRQRSSNVN